MAGDHRSRVSSNGTRFGQPTVSILDLFEKVCPSRIAQTGVKTEQILKGRILGGVQSYLEGICGILPLKKSKEKPKKNLRKYMKNIRKIKKTYIFPYFSSVCLCFDLFGGGRRKASRF